MTTPRNRSTVLSLLLLVWCARAWGSDQGSIEGSVADPSGAMVTGVAVMARRSGTAALFEATTDHRGLFRLPVLPIGTYEVTAERPPFASVVCRDVPHQRVRLVHLALSRAQLGGQRVFVEAASALSSEPSFSLREDRTRLA